MRSLPRALARSLVVTLTIGLVAAMAATVPAYAGNKATPGNFTGYGFDQCLAPTQAQMDVWLENSPFLAAGIYVSGGSRACRDQPNLTPTWVANQLKKGWRLLPIHLGPQASCNGRFPRYGSDPVIDDDPGTDGLYRDARAQGSAEAKTAVTAAKALGITAGSTLWYDIEAYDQTQTKCRESALAFLSAWTNRLHKLDYVSGIYSSAGSGILVLDQARASNKPKITMPDYIWVARWDNVANTSTSYISEAGWNPHRRVKQYMGGHPETWGGVTINIDRNFLDVGKGSVRQEGIPLQWQAHRLPSLSRVEGGQEASRSGDRLEVPAQGARLLQGQDHDGIRTEDHSRRTQVAGPPRLQGPGQVVQEELGRIVVAGQATGVEVRLRGQVRTPHPAFAERRQGVRTSDHRRLRHVHRQGRARVAEAVRPEGHGDHHD